MERRIERGAGLDDPKETVAGCVRVPGPTGAREQQGRTLGTMTADLLALRDWLAAHQVTDVAMRNVPGRKTDGQDCVWIAQLLEPGLLRGSFVAPGTDPGVTGPHGYREGLIQERGRETQRLEKGREEAGVKLASVATDILGARAERCWRRSCTGPPIPTRWPSWPKADCVPSCRRCGRLGRALSGASWVSGQRALGASG